MNMIKYPILTALIFACGQLVSTPVDDFHRFISYGQFRKAQVLLESLSLSGNEKYFLQGYLFIKNKETKEALDHFTSGVASSPKELLFQVGQGYSLLQAGQVKEGLASIGTSIEKSRSKHPELLYYASEALTVLNPEVALQYVNKAIDLRPGEGRYLILRGDIQLRLQNAGEAVSDYEEAFKYDPSHGVPYHRIGKLYLSGKNIPRAEEAFQTSLKADPRYPAIYQELAELAFLKKDLAGAQSHYSRFFELEENIPADVKGRYGYICYLRASYPQAITIFQEIIATDAGNSLIRKYLAYALSEQEDKEMALAAFETYFQLTPPESRDWKDHEVYGKLLLSMNRTDEGLASFEAAVSKNPTSAELIQLVGEAAFKAKNYPSAARMYEQLIPLRKTANPQDHFILGRAYYALDSFKLADQAFSKLVELQPQSHIGYLWKARTLSNLDPETTQGFSRPFYERVIELIPPQNDKYSSDLKEAHSYLGYYFFLTEKTDSSLLHWEKVKLLDPENEQAREVIKILTSQNEGN